MFTDLVGLLQSISGVYLVMSLLKIRNFFRGKSEKEVEMNIKTMLIHSTSFLLYLFASVTQLIAFNIFVIEDENSSLPDYYSFTLLFEAAVSFIA